MLAGALVLRRWEALELIEALFRLDSTLEGVQVSWSNRICEDEPPGFWLCGAVNDQGFTYDGDVFSHQDRVARQPPWLASDPKQARRFLVLSQRLPALFATPLPETMAEQAEGWFDPMIERGQPRLQQRQHTADVEAWVDAGIARRLLEQATPQGTARSAGLRL